MTWVFCTLKKASKIFKKGRNKMQDYKPKNLTDKLLNGSGVRTISGIYKLSGSPEAYKEWFSRQIKMGAAKRRAKRGKDKVVNERRKSYGGLWDN